MTKGFIKITFRQVDNDEQSQNEWKRFAVFRGQCDSWILIFTFNAVR